MKQNKQNKKEKNTKLSFLVKLNTIDLGYIIPNNKKQYVVN